jgi:TetR/AcrR family transcriptional repressor of nem operon
MMMIIYYRGMPRVSREQTAYHQQAIVETASRLFREHGLDGISVAGLMAAAGLTHGGFYGHFDSKEALAATACRSAYEDAVGRWRARVARSPDAAAARALLVERYLSDASRDRPGRSCPTAALVGDVAREPAGSAVGVVFRDGNAALLEILAALQGTGDAARNRREALGDFCTMVGSLILARATRGHALSDAFLAAGRDRLLPSKRRAAASRAPVPTRPPTRSGPSSAPRRPRPSRGGP